MRVFLSVAMLLACTSWSLAGRVVLAGPPAVSHCRELAAIGQELVQRGHVVKAYYPDYFKPQRCFEGTGVEVIEFKVPEELAGQILEGFETIGREIFRGSQGFGILFTMLPLMSKICDAFLQSNFSVLSTEAFDLAIVDAIFMNRCLLVLPAYLSIPVVAEGTFIDSYDASAPFQGGRYPHILYASSRVSGLLSRLSNTALHLVYRLLIEFYNSDIDVSHIHPNLTNFSANQVMRDALLYVENSDHILDEPKACLPNFIQAPALTAAPPKPLPACLERVMADARVGVLVVGFGSSLDTVPQDFVEKMLPALQRLNLTVLMKLKDVEERRGNIVFRSWLPMNDVLGHQKTVAFVSHCGKNSFYESVFHAVPILCLPINADGYNIASQVESRGIGLQLDIRAASTEAFHSTLMAVLWKPTYREHMRRASSLLRAPALSGRERAASAIEHVMAFGGTHLQSRAAREENYLEHLCLDVWLLAVFSVQLILFSCLKTVRFLNRCRVKNKRVREKQE